MRYVRLSLRVLTPLFLAGADQKEAELRPPSLRGALRYWFRAMMGGLVGDHGVEELHSLEAQVFGSTNQASAITMRIEGHLSGRDFPRPESSGLGYLFFSMAMQERQYIPAGSDFRVILQEGLSKGKAMEAALGSLWLLIHLGGLGSRARRGGGNLGVPGSRVRVRVKGISPKSALRPLIKSLQVRAKTIPGLVSHLESGLKRVKHVFQEFAQVRATPSERPSYTVIHPDFYNLWLLDKTWVSWEDALDEVGGAYREFRHRRQPDYGNVKNFLQRQAGAPHTIERAAFGLPLRFYYPSLRGARSVTIEGQQHERRASPLGFRLLRLSGGRYAVLVSLSKAEFLPRREGLQMAGQTAAQPSWNIIDTFIEELDREIGTVEVAVP